MKDDAVGSWRKQTHSSPGPTSRPLLFLIILRGLKSPCLGSLTLALDGTDLPFTTLHHLGSHSLGKDGTDLPAAPVSCCFNGVVDAA